MLSIDPLAEGATDIHLVKREIQIWRDDRLIHWGVPWNADGSPASLEFQCEGILSLLRKRHVDRMSLDYDSLDQLAIAWDLVRYAQDESVQANRNLNISASNFSASGVPRSPRYDRAEHAKILDLLSDFPDMSNGFEYDITFDAAGRNRYWTPYFPRKGSFKPEFHMRYDIDKSRNIADFTYSEDGAILLTHAYVAGGSAGEVKFEQNYENLAASAEYGVMQEVISEGSQMDLDWLHDRAVREVEARKVPAIQTEITSITTEDLELGDVVTGDWLPVRINYGRIQASAYYRVKTITWDPDADRITYGFDGEAIAA